VVRHLSWVPHTVTPPQGTDPVTLSSGLLRQLGSIGHHGWQFIISLDASWPYLSTDHAQIWLRAERQPPERPRHTIQDSKMIVTIAWNPLGFHFLNALPKGNTFNAEYYRVNILTKVVPLRRQIDGRRLVIHADNARPHTARKCRPLCEEKRPASPYTHRPHLISHHPTSFSSDISNIVCGESLFHHVRNCKVVQKSVRYPPISTDNLLAWPNLLSNDAWFVLNLIAFLNPISSAR
jgi:hypothetical protein